MRISDWSSDVCSSDLFALGMLDRIGFVAHRLNLVAAAIFGGVGHRMAPVPIGLHLEDDRPLAGAHPGERFPGGAARREHVHPVDLDARDAEAFAAPGALNLIDAAVDPSAHTVLLFLYPETHT